MPSFTERNFTGGELDPALHARADLTKYQTGLRTLRNFIIQKQGGVTKRGGTLFIGEVKDSGATQRLIPFEFNKEQAYILEFGDRYMRVIRNDGYVLDDSTAVSIAGATQTGPITVEATGHTFADGDEIFISGVGGMTELNGKRYIVSGVAGDFFNLSGVDGGDYAAYTSGGTATAIFELATPYLESELPLLKYTQSADVLTIAHPSHAQRNLSRTDHDAWTLATISYSPGISPPSSISVSQGGGGGGDFNKDYKYVVTAVAEDGEESLQSAPASLTTNSLDGTHYAVISWSTVADAEYYNVYKAESEVSNVYGWIGESKTLSFKDYNLLPDVTDTPAEDRNPFDAVGNYPGVVGYYQQRQIFGRTDNNLQTLYASQSGQFNSFRLSRPTKADDAIERTIASETVNEIRHLVDMDALLILTSAAEWRVTEGENAVLTPATVGFRRQTKYGCSHVRPVVVGDTVIFAQSGGRRLRDMAYRFQSDGFGGNDISILSEHLFKTSTIRDMAYAQEPDSVIWVVMADGSLNAVTYQKEHQIWGWHRHDTDGTFESVATIPESENDATYFIVKRTINGEIKKYVEKLQFRDFTDETDVWFVDCGLQYNGTPTTTITGLDHLEGQTVSAVADGVVENNLTVTNGSVTLAAAASLVTIGLRYTGQVETLDIDVEFAKDSMPNSLRNRNINVSKVLVKLLESRGGKIGPDATRLTTIRSRDLDDNYDSMDLRSREEELYIDKEWQDNGRVLIQHDEPMPMTITAIVPEFDVG